MSSSKAFISWDEVSCKEHYVVRLRRQKESEDIKEMSSSGEAQIQEAGSGSSSETLESFETTNTIAALGESGSGQSDDEDDFDLEANDAVVFTEPIESSGSGMIDDDDFTSSSGDIPLIISRSSFTENSEEEYSTEDPFEENLFLEDAMRKKRAFHLNDDDDFIRIRELLGLDDFKQPSKERTEEDRIIRSETNYIEIDGLEVCTNYTLDIQVIYPYGIIVDSEVVNFKTLCKEDCDVSMVDFHAGKEGGWLMIDVENNSDCEDNYLVQICPAAGCETPTMQTIKDGELTWAKQVEQATRLGELCREPT